MTDYRIDLDAFDPRNVRLGDYLLLPDEDDQICVESITQKFYKKWDSEILRSYRQECVVIKGKLWRTFNKSINKVKITYRATPVTLTFDIID